MSQTDMNVANGSGAVVRADINAHLDALVTESSGATEPSTKFAYMKWVDTSTGLVKQRNAANTAWITKELAADGILSPSTTSDLTAGFTGTSFALGSLSSATTLHISDGNVQDATMAGSFTLTAPDDTTEGYVEVEMTIDATGGYTLTLSGFNELSGTFDATALAVNILRISKLNTNTYIEISQAV